MFFKTPDEKSKVKSQKSKVSMGLIQHQFGKLFDFSKLKAKSETGAGFTLLEIIVVFSVIAIVATVGVAAFVNYSKTQSLQTSYLDLKSTLATAKSYSLSQIKPAECATFTLIGYEVSLDIFNNKYSLIAKCQGFDKTLKTSSFPANIIFNPILTTSNSFLFPVLSKTITGGSIIIDGYGDQKVITIDDLGGIR